MQDLSPKQVESIVIHLTKWTPRSEAFKQGLRAGLVLRYNNEANTVCPWRPGSVEYDAFGFGRDAGETYWKYQALQMGVAA